MNTTDDLSFNQHLNPLMGGWRAIVEDSRRMVAIAAQLPDSCDCADAAHPCECCATRAPAFPEHCRMCADHFRHLAPRVSTVLDDTLRYLPAIETLTAADSVQLRQSFPAVRRAISQMLATVDAVQSATGDFRHGCRTQHVVTLKESIDRVAQAVEDAHKQLRAL